LAATASIRSLTAAHLPDVAIEAVVASIGLVASIGVCPTALGGLEVEHAFPGSLTAQFGKSKGELASA